jgi:hypothetical protein
MQRRAALGFALALALLAGTAHAEAAADLVARLAARVCVPNVLKPAAAPLALPPGGVLMSAAAKKAVGIDARATAWRYGAADDKVVLEMGPGGCNVLAEATGDESYLKALEHAVMIDHPSLYIETDEATAGGDNVRWRTYALPLDGHAEGALAQEELSVTYSTAATSPAGRMFFVGVVPSQKK